MLELGIAIAALIVVCLGASWGLSWLVRRLALSWGVVDHTRRDKSRSLRRQPVPLLGGIAVYVAAMVPACVAVFAVESVRATIDVERLVALLVAGAVAMLLGLLDDRRPLSGRVKFLVQLPLALVFAAFVFHVDALRIPGLNEPIELGIFAIPFTALWIVGVVNAMNLIDGLDGLSPGVALIAALCGAAFAAGLGQLWLMVIMLALAAACAGFLVHNFAPARLYLGDTGSLMLGAVLAIGLLFATDGARPYTIDPLIFASLILGYPIADTLLAMFRRILHGKPVMSADTEHIHHLLLARGFGRRRAALCLYVVAAMFACLALSLWINDYVLIGLSLMGVSSALTLGLILIGFFRPFLPGYVRRNRPHYQLMFHLAGAAEAKLRLAQSTDEVLARLAEGLQSLHVREATVSSTNESQPGAEPTSTTLHSWSNNNDTESETAHETAMPLSLAARRWRLTGTFDPTGLPAPLHDEYVQRIRHVLWIAESRIERSPGASSSDALWPALTEDEPAQDVATQPGSPTLG